MFHMVRFASGVSLPRLRNIAGKSVLAVLAFAVFAVSGCVPDPARSQTVSEGWGAGLAPAFSDVGYLPESSDPAHTLNIYPSTSGGSRGTIVFVHGGGFTSGSKEDVSRPLLRQTTLGWSLVSVNYRLVSGQQNLFPAAVHDVAAAIRWVSENGGQFGLDTTRIVVAGHSAGGTLAALVGTAWNSGLPEFEGIPRVDGYVAIAPLLDCTAGPSSAGFCRGWLGAVNEAQLALPSAVSYWDPQDPPGFLIHHISDNIAEVANSLRFARIAAANTKLDLVDRLADGTVVNLGFMSHWPMGAANSVALDAFLATR